MLPVVTDAGDAREAMLAFEGMLGDTEIPVDPVNVGEKGMGRFVTVLCIGNVLILAVSCCWEFTQLILTWTNSVSIDCLAIAEREKLRNRLNFLEYTLNMVYTLMQHYP